MSKNLCYYIFIMKKIVVLLGLLLSWQSCSVEAAFSAENTDLQAKVEVQQQTDSDGLKTSDVVVFSQDGKFGLKDKQGIVVVEPEYKKLIRVGNSSWIIQKKSRFGLMDSNGIILIKPKYRHVERISGNMVKLGNDNDFGLYDEYGHIIIEPDYSSIEPLFGNLYLTCKDYKYGVIDQHGKLILINDFEDIYMPDPHSIRLRYQGEWYEISQITADDIELPDGVNKVVIDNKEFKVTHMVANTGIFSGYYTLTATDYLLKLFSSISPAYEDTIDELMFSQGADGISIFVKLGWLPRFPFTYAKKYYQNFMNPNNGPLSDLRQDLKRQIK